MRKPIKVDGEDVRMSPAQLYHRLLCIARTNGPPDPCIFSAEMTAFAPALFKEDCSMRTSQKSQLAKHIVGGKIRILRGNNMTTPLDEYMMAAHLFTD